MEINIETVLSVATSIVGTAAIVAAITPNKWDNVVIKMLRTILDTLAMNVGKAKNKD